MSEPATLTALVITHDEQENIGRTLDSIAWVDRIIVIDSGSSDATLDIVARYHQAKVVYRKFTTFAEQCNFGLSLVESTWILSIDADYVFPPEAEGMIRGALESNDAAAYSVEFLYAVYGKVVKGSILPPRTVLYQRDQAQYQDDGHGHRVHIQAPIGHLSFRIVHDDRKPLVRWVTSQVKYAQQEADKLRRSSYSSLAVQDKLRCMCLVAPLMVFFLVYILRGGFLSGWHGFYYALQRFFFEVLLSLFLVDGKLKA